MGVGAAVLLAAGGGVAAYYLVGSYDGSDVQTIFETVTYVLAATILTYMTFWMRGHARTISSELQERAERAMTGGERVGLGLLSFQAVGREGLETAVFTLAIVFAGERRAGTGFASSPQGELLGGLLGLVAALGVAYAMYHLGKRINLGRFFLWLGVILMLFAAGLVADTVENLQQLGWVTIGSQPLWDSSRQVSEGSNLGDVLHSLFGYADHPTVLQAVCYVAYLVIAVGAFVAMSRRDRAAGRRARAAAAAKAPGEVTGPGSAPAPTPAVGATPGGGRPPATELSPPASTRETKASWGISTRPIDFIRFLPSFCFSRSLRLRVMSPP